MGLKRRISAILACVAVAIMLPMQPAVAGATFGTPTSVNPNGLSSFSYTSLQSSADGSILVAAAGYSYLLRSIDSGTTWSTIPTAGVKYWYTVAINDSGTVIAAAESSGSVWVSTNSGATWTQQTSGITTGSWYMLDMNASGNLIAATNQSGTVYTTSNFGTSWSGRTITGASGIRGIAVSATGDKMAVNSIGDSSIYTSSDTGATWTKQVSAGTTSSTAPQMWMSRDGQKILYPRSDGASGTWLGITQNFGSSWETVTGTGTSIVAFTASDNLSNIWIAPNGSSTYYSVNSGSTWTTSGTATYARYMSINPTGTRWVSMAGNFGIYTSDGAPTSMTYRPVNTGGSIWSRSAMSSDGSLIVAAGAYGEINYSSDGGTTWAAATTPGRNNAWGCVAVSGDGNVIYVGGITTRLWKSTNRGASWTALSGGTLPASAITITGCATNSDGTRVAISYNTSGIHISNNSGSTFALSQASSNCPATSQYSQIAMTADGNKIAAVCDYLNSKVFISTNGGTSWSATTATTPRFYKDIKCSADGSILIATVDSTYPPIISKDWGATWSNLTGIGLGYSSGLSINSNGSVILIGQTSSTANLYYSLNRGVSFSQASGLNTGLISIATINSNSTVVLLGADGRQLQVIPFSLVIEQASFSSLTVNSTPSYRGQVTITATIASAGGDGKVTFTANGKRIPGCIKVSTTALVATCTWKPAVRGSVTLSATSYPIDGTFLSTTSSIPIGVTGRTGLR